MISLTLARRLRDAGLKWEPASGDRFVVADRNMDDDVFTLSEMTVDVHRIAGETLIGFNGTTEWALDSVEMQQSVWLPNESQLRERLGGAFRRLEPAEVGWRVTLEVADRPVVVEHEDAAEAYGRALLHLVTGEDPAAVPRR